MTMGYFPEGIISCLVDIAPSFKKQSFFVIIKTMMIVGPLLLVLLSVAVSDAFVPSSIIPRPQRQSVSVVFAEAEDSSYLDDLSSSANNDDEPSDVNNNNSYEPEEVESPRSAYLEEMKKKKEKQPVEEEEEEDLKKNTPSSSVDVSSGILMKLLPIAASTGRGEFATSQQKNQAAGWIAALELVNPTPEPANSPLINGRWELLYSSTQLFRSSPFFMAGRAVCSTPEQAQQYDWFCEMHRKALAISSIGQVRQIVTPTRLVSEFEVQVGAIPFLSDFTPFSYSGGWPVTIDGAIVSSADISPSDDGNGWELYIDTGT
jgi:hypothetical protein